MSYLLDRVNKAVVPSLLPHYSRVKMHMSQYVLHLVFHFTKISDL